MLLMLFTFLYLIICRYGFHLYWRYATQNHSNESYWKMLQYVLGWHKVGTNFKGRIARSIIGVAPMTACLCSCTHQCQDRISPLPPCTSKVEMKLYMAITAEWQEQETFTYSELIVIASVTDPCWPLSPGLFTKCTNFGQPKHILRTICLTVAIMIIFLFMQVVDLKWSNICDWIRSKGHHCLPKHLLRLVCLSIKTLAEMTVPNGINICMRSWSPNSCGKW